MIDTRFLDVIPAIGATLSRPTRRAVVAGACGAAALVAASMGLSWVFASVDFFSFMSEGARVIFLTVAISAAAALLFPVRDEEASK